MAQSALEAARVAASRTEQELRAHIAEKDAELFRANESLKVKFTDKCMLVFLFKMSAKMNYFYLYRNSEKQLMHWPRQRDDLVY
jgi:hypothetical protein